MRVSITATELGLALIFLSRSVTRVYGAAAIARHGVTGARVASTPGSGVIPLWVSLLVVVGWLLALIAGAWTVVTHLAQ